MRSTESTAGESATGTRAAALPEGTPVKDAAEARALAEALLRWAEDQESRGPILPPLDPARCRLCGKELEGIEEGVCMDCAFLYLEAPRGSPTLLSEILQGLQKDADRVQLDYAVEMSRLLDSARRTAQLLPEMIQAGALGLLYVSETRTTDHVRRDVARLIQEVDSR